mmetsp:Transcript_32927/g.72638  ORF Transcript_32927/g.72638 Transcript_32927/m.72638 type:complete len:308 (-) Transcript_32927:82-1005(-)
MTKLSTALLLSTGPAAVTAFNPLKTNRAPTKLDANSLAAPLDERPVFDPLGLYPKDSPERKNGRIRPLESTTAVTDKPIVDPLNLYAEKATIDGEADMSIALPFTTRPQYLDGSMAGDAGFDPLGLAANPDRLKFMRESELKHSRIAMLAAVGWPVAELFHRKLAFAADLKPLLQSGDRVPSILNGGLGHVLADYWPYMFATLAFGAAVEAFTEYDKKQGMERAPGDLGLDLFNIFANKDDESKKALELSELKHGRIAMLAIAFFAFQEALTGVGVVPQLLSALHPHASEFTASELANLPNLLARAF